MLGLGIKWARFMDLRLIFGPKWVQNTIFPRKKRKKKWSLEKENFGRTWREERRVMENLRKSYGEIERPPST